VDKVMENFKKGPNVSEAAKVGEPTLVDPKQTSAPEMVRSANASVVSALTNLNGNNQVTVERLGNGATPPANSLVPRSDTPPAAGPAGGTPPAGSTDSTAVPELQNDLQPVPAPDVSGAPEKAPPQVNDAAASNASASGSSQATATAGDGTQAQATQANPNTESTSKKKKKKILGVF
jgi:hypothetical protein